MLAFKPDFEDTLRRIDAFWARDMWDRPLINLSLPRPDARPVPQRDYPDQDTRWLDVAFRAEQRAMEIENRLWLADSLPIAFPRLGPGIYSAWHGVPYHFTETTGWNDPLVLDWDRDMPAVRLDMDHPMFRATEEFTRHLLALGKDRFLVGLTDIHFGADHFVALRGPETFCIDLLERPEAVIAALEADFATYLRVYDHFYGMLRAGGSYACTWMPGLLGRGRFYVPSNDFSCMISTEMFERFFLDRLARECAALDHSIYHLDGPDALRHLDAILSIEALDAVQWVCGAGNEGFARWAPVYRRIQGAGKALQLYVDIAELPLVFEALRPQGVHFASITGVPDQETADAVIRRIARWQ